MFDRSAVENGERGGMEQAQKAVKHCSNMLRLHHCCPVPQITKKSKQGSMRMGRVTPAHHPIRTRRDVDKGVKPRLRDLAAACTYALNADVMTLAHYES